MKYRPDIDGLRAIAVVLVVAYHAGVPPVSGGFVGVDVFFVVSGFLITGLLLGEVKLTGRISILNFLARRVRRLLPMATVVLVGTAIGTVIVVAPIDRGSIADGIRASTVWLANVFFIWQSTDYFTTHIAQNPTLHYWSLSVEEQFYLLWPITVSLAACGLPNSKDLIHIRRLLVTTVTIVLVSLAISFLTRYSGGVWSYYGLHTRAWELGAGALLAISASTLPRWSDTTATILRILGLTVILYSAVTFTSRTPFPGYAAAFPVAGTAIIIAAGIHVPASNWLEHRILVFVGLRSYSLYLWHWPLLAFAATIQGVNPDDRVFSFTASFTIAAIVLACLASDLSYRFIENPIRKSRRLAASPLKTFGLGAIMIVGALLAAFLATGTEKFEGSSNTARTPEQARADGPRYGDSHKCALAFREIEIDKKCIFGDPNGTISVVLVGDSHAGHIAVAADRLAAVRGWKLWIWTKGACPIAETPVVDSYLQREYFECEQWRQNLSDAIAEIPNLALVIVGRSGGYERTAMDAAELHGTSTAIAELWAKGMEATLRKWGGAVPAVAVLRDTPGSPHDVASCLSAHNMRADACSFPDEADRDAELVKGETAAARALAGSSHSPILNVVDPEFVRCAGQCGVVTENGTIAYRDRHHLTRTYAGERWRRLATVLDPLMPIQPEKPKPPLNGLGRTSTKSSEQGAGSHRAHQ
ncbi:acyltransferase [Gammaproteobacteria bacterium]|nr:acyltransferase [Gammaproteobacteria bacterium]